MQTLRSVFVLLSLLLSLSQRADAALVTWTITGSLGGVNDPGGTLGIQLGDPFTYSLLFDSSVPGADVGGGSYSFADAILAMSFTSGSLSVSLPPGTTEGFTAFANNFRAWGPVLLQMTDVEPAVTLTLPVAPPVHAGTQLSLQYGDSFGGPGFLFYVQSSQISYSVPEPGPVLALFAGTLALLALRAPRRARSTARAPRARLS